MAGGQSLWGSLAEDGSRLYGWRRGCLAGFLVMGGTCTVAEDGPGGVVGMIRMGSPKNAALEGGAQRGRLTELTW